MLIARESIEPSSRRIYSVNFPWLAADEVVTVVTVSTEPNDGIFELVDLGIDVGGKQVRFVAYGGGSEENQAEEYLVRLLVTTNLGNVNDDCVRFIVNCGGCC
tara:strand:- start:2968 stop:3276 length:309 start_codon:yes stop_codon:yes gene_type:complete